MTINPDAYILRRVILAVASDEDIKGLKLITDEAGYKMAMRLYRTLVDESDFAKLPGFIKDLDDFLLKYRSEPVTDDEANSVDVEDEDGAVEDDDEVEAASSGLLSISENGITSRLRIAEEAYATAHSINKENLILQLSRAGGGTLERISCKRTNRLDETQMRLKFVPPTVQSDDPLYAQTATVKAVKAVMSGCYGLRFEKVTPREIVLVLRIGDNNVKKLCK